MITNPQDQPTQVEKKKKLPLALILLALLFIIGVITVYFVFFKGKNAATDKQSNDSQSTSQTIDIPTENFIKCDVNSQKNVYYKIVAVTYMSSGGYTAIFANGPVNNENIDTIQLGFPGDAKAGTFHRMQGNPDASVNTKINGVNYETDTDQRADVVITTYDGDTIKGTFSADALEITPTGHVTNGKQATYRNCVIDSTKARTKI